MKEELSFIKFIQEYNTEEKCIDFLKAVRWRDGIQCPRCDSYSVFKFMSEERYECKRCDYHFCIKSKTIMQNTKVSLRVWLFLCLYIATNKKTKSSVQFSKDFGVTQATMWRIYTKIKSSLTQDESLKLSGVVEVDECFVSKPISRYKNNKWGAISKRKLPILGFYERDRGLLVIKKIPDRTGETILNEICSTIESGSTIFTDSFSSYSKLNQIYQHCSLNHSEGEYANRFDNSINTNSIEGFWARLKNHIRGSHHSVSDHYIDLYINEIVYKNNTSNMTDMERFLDIVNRVLNKRNYTNYELSERALWNDKFFEQKKHDEKLYFLQKNSKR